MKAIGFKTSHQIGHQESFIEFEKAKPSAQGKDILVKVNAISINPVDYKFRQRMAVDKVLDTPMILGYDGVGIVEEIGQDVKNMSVGDRVYYSGDISRDGSSAEYQLVDSRVAALAPKTLSDAQAAALPLTALTSWEGLFDRLRVKPNEKKTILIIGAAGGIGSILTQITKKLTNLTVIATASREESISWVKSLGADYVANHHDLVNSVKSLGFDTVDYIYNAADTIGHWDATAELIAPQGSICQIVDFEGKIDFMKLQTKSVTVTWEMIYTRILFNTEDVEEQHKTLERLASLIDGGIIKPTLTKTLEGFTVENMKKAHELVESGKTIGKIAINFN